MVLVHITDRHLLRIQWEGLTYIDGVLMFGLCSASTIFNSITDLLQWIIIDYCHMFVLHYLDDFLLIGLLRSSHCAKALDKTQAICQASASQLPLRKWRAPQPNSPFWECD